ncbi:hypothetical protein FRC04_012165 [Tulasnella sp. 424]|nr:hypothetical protein FRC04_012165 [Tulasnella sp. 424]KAG8970936.1 hypothetical protein FRC05_011610 [Tulasnella sp. 425]
MNASSPFYLPTTQPLGAAYMSEDGREAAEELDFPEPLARPFQSRGPEYMPESDSRMEVSDEPSFPEPLVQPFQPPKATYMAESDERMEGSDEWRPPVAQPDYEDDEPERSTQQSLSGHPQTLESPEDGSPEKSRARPNPPVAEAPRRDDKKKKEKKKKEEDEEKAQQAANAKKSRCIIC